MAAEGWEPLRALAERLQPLLKPVSGPAPTLPYIMAAALMAQDESLGAREACRRVPGADEHAGHSRAAKLALKIRALQAATEESTAPVLGVCERVSAVEVDVGYGGDSIEPASEPRALRTVVAAAASEVQRPQHRQAAVTLLSVLPLTPPTMSATAPSVDASSLPPLPSKLPPKPNERDIGRRGLYADQAEFESALSAWRVRYAERCQQVALRRQAQERRRDRRRDRRGRQRDGEHETDKQRRARQYREATAKMHLESARRYFQELMAGGERAFEARQSMHKRSEEVDAQPRLTFTEHVQHQKGIIEHFESKQLARDIPPGMYSSGRY